MIEYQHHERMIAIPKHNLTEVFIINKDETHAFVDGEWREINSDQDGEHYVSVFNTTLYIRVFEQIPSPLRK